MNVSEFTNRDAALLSRAIMQRWPITDTDREKVIKKLMEIVTDPNAKRREVLSASRGLMAAERQNQSDEQVGAELESTKQDRNRFFAVAERLGLRSPSEGDTGGGEAIDLPTVEGAIVNIGSEEAAGCDPEKEGESGRHGGIDTSGSGSGETQ